MWFRPTAKMNIFFDTGAEGNSKQELLKSVPAS
jgi:hypothetical protein